MLLTFWTELRIELFGSTATPAGIVASFIFVFMGAGINFYIEVRRRDKDSVNTPFDFSWKFLLNDNGWRLFGTGIMSFMFVCMGPGLITWLSDFVKIPDAMAHFSPFFLGIGGDYVPMLLKEKLYKSRRVVVNTDEPSGDKPNPNGDEPNKPV